MATKLVPFLLSLATIIIGIVFGKQTGWIVMILGFAALFFTVFGTGMLH